MRKYIIIAGIIIAIVGKTIHFRLLTIISLIMMFFNGLFLPKSELNKKNDRQKVKSKKRIILDDDDD